jgi:hypothetical protein
VNGDGFSDVVIGAPVGASFEGPSDEGEIFVFHGSPTGLTQFSLNIGSGQNLSYFGAGAAGAGDVNGDGFSDVVVGAPLFDNGEPNEGQVFLYYGNYGAGLSRIPRQARSDDSAPIHPLGRSNSLSSFRIKSLGRTPAGRGRVRLQIEVKPAGTPFDGLGLVTGSATTTGTPTATGSAVPLSLVATGLTSETVYRWRLRTLTDSPFFPRSRWYWLPGNAVTEADVRTPAVIGVEEAAGVAAASLRLGPASPNPFRAATVVEFTIPNDGSHRLAVYDVHGRVVRVLAAGKGHPGRHLARWDGRNSGGEKLAAGVYFLRFDFAGRSATQKVVLAP